MNNYRPQGSRPFNQGQGRPQDGRPGGSGGGHSQQPALEKITAPYNFVPLSKKVFFPDWAGHVSHDVPFSDGLSGELVCELTTQTPVYVRNGGKWDNVMNSEEAQSFFRVGDEIIIPGSTLKGMMRNVIEIASFGKMNKVDDHRYSVRDLHNKDLYMSKMKNVQAAWLRRAATGDGWVLIPCDFALISHELLDNESIKKAQKSLGKYNSWGWDRLDVRFKYKKGSVANRVIKMGEGELGRLVFTGQPKANTGGKFDKKNEFVFFSPRDDCPIAVSREMQQDIEFLYSNPNTGKPLDEWDHWKKALEKGKDVPVFYQMDGNVLGSFGFTRMYRLPYTHRIRQVIDHTTRDHRDPKPDLAETMFGYVDGRRDALKGRISISPAVAERSTVRPFAEAVTAVLGSAKPTFYPNYVNQPAAGHDGKVNGEYRSFMDRDAELRGWKRYPVRQLKDVVRNQEAGTDNVATRFIPLSEGARFVFTIKVHNLKREELGALVWALTWGNDDKLRHSLGMGKSLGYGVVGIRIASSSILDMAGSSVEWTQAVHKFSDTMDMVVGGGWLETAQMEQLLGMANPSLVPQCGQLRHMSLAKKDFSNAKGSLKPFRPKLSLLPHVRPKAKSDQERFRNLLAAEATPKTPHVHQKERRNNENEVANLAGPADLSSLAALAGKYGRKK